MTRENFEIEWGNRLRNAEMPVPKDAWAAIQQRINTGVHQSPIKNSPPFSNTGFIAGISIGAVMLASLSVYTHLEHSSSDKIGENYMYLQPKVIVVQHADAELKDDVANFEDEELAEVSIEDTSHDSPAVFEEHIKNTNERTAITVRPIPATNVKEIQTKRKKHLDQRNLASKKQAVKSVITPAVAKISADKITGSAPLSVNFKNRGQGDVHYWKFGSKTDSYETSPTVLFEDPGTYTVTLIVENKEGEIDEDVLTIRVVEGSQIFIPNSFTPNGDGHNDTYKVASSQNIEEFHMVVTNQMGKVVYESRDINGAWEFDKSEHGNAGDMFFLTYMAIGTDGAVHAENLRPIYIFY